jgi:hypothetical protein
MKTLREFSIPGNFTDQTPFDQMHIWQWALTQTRANVDPFKYLDSLWFVVGTDRLTEDQFDRLCYACDAFHVHAPRMPAAPFADLFRKAGPKDSGQSFWVQEKPGRWIPAPSIVECLQASGWIYDITPDTTFFQIIGGNRLFAKYQTIIGSRFLCEVK